MRSVLRVLLFLLLTGCAVPQSQTVNLPQQTSLAIIQLRGGDVVPALLQLLRRTDYLKRGDVITLLEKLKDPQSVSTMTSMLCYDREWFVSQSRSGSSPR